MKKNLTKPQKEVLAISEALPDLLAEIQPWAFENCIEHRGFRTRTKGVHCLSCGHIFPEAKNPKLVTLLEPEQLQCPNCRRTLKVTSCRKKRDRQLIYCAVIKTAASYQLNRIFQMRVYHHAGRAPVINCREVTRQFLNPINGKHQVVSLNCGGGMYGSDCFGGEMEIRQPGTLYDKYDIYTNHFYSGIEVLPIYEKHGFNGHFRSISPFSLFDKLITEPKCETLYKAGYYGFLEALIYKCSYKIQRYWQSVKICMRNNYNLCHDDVITWVDYLDLLERYNKDVNNPHYICPKDLDAQHNRYVAKRRAEQLQQERQRREAELQRMKEQEEKWRREYALQKAKYFNLLFTDGELTIVPLKSIDEFKQEGDLLKHCLYTNAYYTRQHSLILSARIDGKPIETIEVDLTQFNVTQSRGMNNKPTEYHSQIIDLINENISKIKQASKKAIKKTTGNAVAA
jgi:hypothetical protein